MRVVILSLAVLFCATWASGLTLSSLFGGSESQPEGASTSEELVLVPEPEGSIQEHYKPEKPHTPFLPELFKPEIHKPVKKPVKKPIKKPIKKPVKKPIKKPIKKPHKKPVKKPGKPCSIFSHISLPSLPNFGKLPNKIVEKLPKKKVIKITKTQYVEVTKRQTVHPVCYITLKHKKPCIKEHHFDQDYDETFDQEQNFDLHIEVEEDKGDIEPSAVLQVSPSVVFHDRHAKQVNTSEGNVSEVEMEESDENKTEADEDEDKIEEDEEEAENEERKGRYIEFKEPPVDLQISEEEINDEYDLEPSEDVESRIKPKKEFVTKTILVTRIEKYTDNHVTATVIAKNCAPVTPHVPPCKKKHNAAVIRDRPDGDTPLVIVPVATAVAPPEVIIDAKEIVNDEVDNEAEGTIEEPEKVVADDEGVPDNVAEETNDETQTEAA